ncbi:MAG: hypothetical protein ACTHK7_20505 [Aureliella sp.]
MKLNRPIPLVLPEVELIAATQAALGFGIGLLVARRISRRRRQTVGRTLAMIGAVSTVPLIVDVYTKAGAFKG